MYIHFLLVWTFPSIYPASFSSVQVSRPEGCLWLLVFPLTCLSANNLDTIPAPLLDRMEVLEVSGYVSEEKCVIADKYLGPQAKEASGLKDTDILLEPTTVDVLIKYYCRESGVRNLKKHIDKVGRCTNNVICILTVCCRSTARPH
jgi:ATP-dependent Lon protease